MEKRVIYDEYGRRTLGRTVFRNEFNYSRPYVQGGPRARGIQTRLERPSNPPKGAQMVGGVDKLHELPNAGEK